MITTIEKDVETLPTSAERKFCGISLSQDFLTLKSLLK